MSYGGNNGVNRVFYARSYHPIQARSIDGTNVAAHDNGVCRALLCYSTGLYDPFGDLKAAGDPYCTSHLTTEDTLREAMSKYGKVKSLCLIRHIVTGASRGYAFVEYETEGDASCLQGKHARLLSDMCKFYRAWHVKSDGECYLHNPVSFLEAVQPDLFKYKKWIVWVGLREYASAIGSWIKPSRGLIIWTLSFREKERIVDGTEAIYG
ncbi:unnamed protein product [Brassica napus]|uniref:(rape) hypothetical protein n=1 Tax=Brassica napus TaxID=3708 RepID=A0A816M1I1_BRANA|nr:unnamed protein product [Brassica napus]